MADLMQLMRRWGGNMTNPEIRSVAWGAFRRSWGRLLLAGIIQAILSWVISSAIGLLKLNELSQNFLTMLGSLLLAPFSIGMVAFQLRTFGGEKPIYGSLFDYYGEGRAKGSFFMALAQTLMFIPVVIVIFLVGFFSYPGSGSLGLVGFILMTIAVLLFATCRIAPMNYAFAIDPRGGASVAIRKGWQASKGTVWRQLGMMLRITWPAIVFIIATAFWPPFTADMVLLSGGGMTPTALLMALFLLVITVPISLYLQLALAGLYATLLAPQFPDQLVPERGPERD